MFIAHLPAGYLIGTFIARQTVTRKTVMVATLGGSIIPDFDMAYFYLVDGERTHHHLYFTHWPLFWLALGMLALALGLCLRPGLLPVIMAGFVSVMFHMVMDSVAAPIWWLMPFGSGRAEFFSVPATHANYLVSFLSHWTFALELVICTAAGLLLWMQTKSRAGERLWRQFNN